MKFDPEFSVTDVTPPNDRCPLRVDDALKASILALVERRNAAIRCGDRTGLDSTYCGMLWRWNDPQDEHHEQTSYYDWYLNRIERGMGAHIKAIRVVPVYDFGILPFKHNTNWTGDQPEFELQIEASENRTSWFIKRELSNSGELKVILPSFVDAPWKEPILETRGGTVEFNADKFAKKLAKLIGFELIAWSGYLKGLVKIRAFVLNIDPFGAIISAHLLTDHEDFDEARHGKWCVSDWRLCNFTNAPPARWGHLCDLAQAYVSETTSTCIHPKFDYWSQAREDFDVVLACAMAVREEAFLNILARFEQTEDFELGVFHRHDELRNCNFAKPENQDLSVLRLLPGEATTH